MPDGSKQVTPAVVGSADASNYYPVKILIALHAVMSAVGYVQKKGKNKFQDYKYAGEANVLEVLRPAMVEHGLLLIPSHREVLPIDANGITLACIEYTLAHKDGDVWPEKIVAYGAGGDKNSKGVGDKGLYKALTGANKYLLFKLFQIETGDDPEKESEHDKDDGAPVAAAPAAPATPITKNAPGISEARTWTNGHIRELNACEDGDHFMTEVNTIKARWIKICATYPGLWEGPDGSGLRGEGLKLATIFQCRDQYEAFIKQVVAAASALQQPKQAAQ